MRAIPPGVGGRRGRADAGRGRPGPQTGPVGHPPDAGGGPAVHRRRIDPVGRQPGRRGAGLGGRPGRRGRRRGPAAEPGRVGAGGLGAGPRVGRAGADHRRRQPVPPRPAEPGAGPRDQEIPGGVAERADRTAAAAGGTVRPPAVRLDGGGRRANHRLFGSDRGTGEAARPARRDPASGAGRGASGPGRRPGDRRRGRVHAVRQPGRAGAAGRGGQGPAVRRGAGARGPGDGRGPVLPPTADVVRREGPRPGPGPHPAGRVDPRTGSTRDPRGQRCHDRAAAADRGGRRDPDHLAGVEHHAGGVALRRGPAGPVGRGDAGAVAVGGAGPAGTGADPAGGRTAGRAGRRRAAGRWTCCTTWPTR